jgi:hypothetical protein
VPKITLIKKSNLVLSVFIHFKNAIIICILVTISVRYQKVRLNVALHLEIAQTLTRQPAIYPVKYQQVYEFSKVAQTQVVRETLFTDRLLPSFVYLMILTTDRRLGSYILRYNTCHTNIFAFIF